jgi:hypothetical protein
VSDADDYKLLAEMCLKLAGKAKGAEERALLELAWRFAQLALETAISRPHADKSIRKKPRRPSPGL